MTIDQQDVFEKAIDLATKAEENFIELGQLLRQLQDQDRDLFRQVCEYSQLDLRKAYYLAGIDRQIGGLQIPSALLLKVGWTKVQIIGPHLDADNWPSLVAVAAERSAHELKVILAGKRPVDGTRCVLLYLKPTITSGSPR